MRERDEAYQSLCRYGISSSVYTYCRPFHPKRLWDLVSAPLCVLQTTYEDEDEDNNENSDEGGEEYDMDDEQAKLSMRWPKLDWKTPKWTYPPEQNSKRRVKCGKVS